MCIYIYIYTYLVLYRLYTALVCAPQVPTSLSTFFKLYEYIFKIIYMIWFQWLRHPGEIKLILHGGQYYDVMIVYIHFWGTVETRPLRCIPFVFVMKPQCVCLLLKRSHLE